MQILFADEHALFRESLVYALAELDQDVMVIHAETSAETIAACSYYHEFDLMLLNWSLVDSDGISILPKLRSTIKDAPIVIISSSTCSCDVQRALDEGATSYIPKTIGVQELLFALRRVLIGVPYLPVQLLAGMMSIDSTVTTPDQIEHNKLTVRQNEVLHLLSEGLSNKGIANKLNLSEGTVKIHVSAIIRILNARNRTEAVVLAKKIGLPTNQESML